MIGIAWIVKIMATIEVKFGRKVLVCLFIDELARQLLGEESKRAQVADDYWLRPHAPDTSYMVRVEDRYGPQDYFSLHFSTSDCHLPAFCAETDEISVKGDIDASIIEKAKTELMRRYEDK
jgi:hypothetical protein